MSARPRLLRGFVELPPPPSCPGCVVTPPPDDPRRVNVGAVLAVAVAELQQDLLARFRGLGEWLAARNVTEDEARELLSVLRGRSGVRGGGDDAR